MSEISLKRREELRAKCNDSSRSTLRAAYIDLDELRSLLDYADERERAEARIRELERALRDVRLWLNGDKYRFSHEPDEVAAWKHMTQSIDALLRFPPDSEQAGIDYPYPGEFDATEESLQFLEDEGYRISLRLVKHHHDIIRRALSDHAGEVVVTTNERGDAVAVTRQTEEGEILSVIWERDGGDT